ncbi:MAG: putative two-component sensor protein [Acidimicrobiales bacterium]|nr:putative two-component sensor protein [Acidimicrobiales bacterium]
MPARGGWSSWTLARRLRVALVALSCLLVVAGLTLVVVLREADRALSEQSQRTFTARLSASQLLTALVDQETGLRGYALTGDQQFLEPYRQGLVNEQTARATLERVVPPNDAARLSLLTVDAAITAWRDQYATLRTDGGSSTGADNSIQFGRQLFDRVRQTNSDLDAQLALQLTSARNEADRDRHVVIVVLGLMAAVVFVAVVGLQRALKTTVLQPLDRLAAQVRVVSGGEHRAPIRPEGPPDIREMGEGVESMRVELVGVLAEVESQRRGIERKAAELARSNADLEQFAYVASHDLQEPLRKVASFCQLLEQRYHGQLDDRADQYIAFAVDGAKRMQLLITDLLTFSRVGRTSAGFASVDLAVTVAKAWDGLDDQVRASGALLEVDLAEEARHVHGDASLLQMLLTNLFGNAMKYRRDDLAPVVRVTSATEATTEDTTDAQMVRVEVADNGIGIPDEYAEKVFVIFQRLHGRDEYGGTGIGLALAKKVVEFHGGSIRVQPSALGGTSLSFTLPLEESSPHE